MIRTLFRFVFSVFFWICASLGFVFFILALTLYWGHHQLLSPSSKTIKEDTVLSLVLNGTYTEHSHSSGIESLLLGKNASLYEITDALYKASYDDKIKGLFIRLESPNLGKGQLQELRDAVLAFRDSGKPSWCYADSYGDSSSGTEVYYLATACQEVWLQPMGTVNLVGVSIDVPFMKEALTKLDVHPEIVQRKEYKSFIETFTRDDFSEANREAQQAIADSHLGQFVEGIAKERNLSHDQVRLLVNNGPYLTQEAVNEKLVDHVGYRHELMSAIKNKVGKKASFVDVHPYILKKTHESKGDKVALIFGSGIIQQNGKKSVLDDLFISSNETYKTFQLAIEDPTVKAIVYRINSSGGSPTASESIYSIVSYTKNIAKKPVIISMSDAAASGGYWASVAGSKIIAQPATLTGSIGVFGGKYVLSGLLEKLGVKFGTISTSENSNMWSAIQSFTPVQWVKFNALMDEIYKGFTFRVAQERRLSVEQVEKVARGRVWTGEQALALGLVDQLGGIQLALDVARQEASLKPDAGVIIYPRKKGLLENLMSLFDKGETTSHEMGMIGSFISPLKRVYAAFSFIFAPQNFLYVPLTEIK